MVEIKNIATASIDPESTVNVRKSQIEEGVEKLKSSIAEHGFWENCPIVIRPHPDSSSEYEYEIIVGQCRLNACLELNIERIPAVVKELDDDAAIQESWVENEASSDLTLADKISWANFYFLKYRKQGRKIGESHALTATFLGVVPQTIRNWLPLTVLPEDVAIKLGGDLKEADAVAIIQSCDDVKSDELEQTIRDRAEWIMPMDKRHKEDAREVLKDIRGQASIDDLDKNLVKYKKTVPLKINMREDMRLDVVEYGEKEMGLIGVPVEAVIIAIVVKTLRGR